MVQAPARTTRAPELRDVADPPNRPVPGGVDPLRFAQTLAHGGWTVLLSQPNGSIAGGSDGLYDLDCRVLSRHELRLDGAPLECVSDPLADGDRWAGILVSRRPGGTAAGPHLPQDVIAVAVERRIGLGMRERLTIE